MSSAALSSVGVPSPYRVNIFAIRTSSAFFCHSGESRNPAAPPAFGLFERRTLTLKSDKSYFNMFWTLAPAPGMIRSSPG
jgi:hypothetical protein